jgi:hypothetical protein
MLPAAAAVKLAATCESMRMPRHPSGLSENLLAEVQARLGRPPRGLREVVVSDAGGAPQVIRVASLVDGRPFPTLFWLIDPVLNLRIDREEAGGRIAALQEQVDRQRALRDALRDDHERHIALRLSYLDDRERQTLKYLGMWAAVAERGIGGIADFSRIRCLHTWYAAHLVVPNTVGRELDRLWSCEGSAAP